MQLENGGIFLIFRQEIIDWAYYPETTYSLVMLNITHLKFDIENWRFL